MASYFEFILDGQSYALPVEHVYAIFTLPKVIPMPHSPRHVRGIISLYGFHTPVIDLRRLWGLPEEPVDEHTLAIDITINDQIFAILVDTAIGLVDGDHHSIKPNSSLEHGVADSYIEIDGRVIMLVDVQRLKDGI